MHKWTSCRKLLSIFMCIFLLRTFIDTYVHTPKEVMYVRIVHQTTVINCWLNITVIIQLNSFKLKVEIFIHKWTHAILCSSELCKIIFLRPGMKWMTFPIFFYVLYFTINFIKNILKDIVLKGILIVSITNVLVC